MDDLASRYAVRLPLVALATENIVEGLEQALGDAGLPYSLTPATLVATDFVEAIARCGREMSDPLAEYESQIVCEAAVGSMDDAQPLANLIGEELTVISSGWSDSPEHPDQTLLMVCLVPEWAHPEGWAGRTDVPRVFTVRVGVRPGLRLALQEGNESKSQEPTALIMKGGGIKGLAYVGALEELSSEYDFQWFIGTSAGAIAAVLLAAGYTSKELREILEEKNFRDFFDAPWYKIPWNLAAHHGMYRADAFTEWLDHLLATKLNSHDRVRLSDLPHRATVYASRRNRPVLVFDSEDNDAEAAYAVRCSMSIPIVFTPQFEQGIRAFDGGLQNNFPVEVLLASNPHTPFIGLFLGPETYKPIKQGWVFYDVYLIWTEASDADIVRRYRDKVMVIDPDPIGTLDFKLSDDEKAYLLTAGKASALGHLEPDSTSHRQAIKERDELRQRITAVRSAKKVRRRRCWVIVGLCVTIGVVCWYLF